MWTLTQLGVQPVRCLGKPNYGTARCGAVANIKATIGMPSPCAPKQEERRERAPESTPVRRTDGRIRIRFVERKDHRCSRASCCFPMGTVAREKPSKRKRSPATDRTPSPPNPARAAEECPTAPTAGTTVLRCVPFSINPAAATERARAPETAASRRGAAAVSPAASPSGWSTCPWA